MTIALKNLQKKILIPRAKIFKAVNKAFRRLGFQQWCLSIVFVGTRRMRAINRAYLRHDHVTDVLTFIIGEKSGEIIICPQAAFINARKYQTSTENEIVLYVVHGILHLAGFDDRSEKDKIEMRRMENKLLD